MSVIIGLSGRKKSGKGFLSNYLLNNLHDITPFKTAKIYSFASGLKKIAIEVLGLPSKYVYGSNTDKENKTDIRWESLPHYLKLCQPIDLKITKAWEARSMGIISNETYISTIKDIKYPTGFMTVREVLQEIGTGMFRTIDSDIWVKALVRQIESEKYELAIVDDCRFPNEAATIKDYSIQSKLIRLTRAPFTEDEHVSETALDSYKNFSFVLDNQNLTEEETIQQFRNYIMEAYHVAR